MECVGREGGSCWLGNTWRGEYVRRWWLGRCRSLRRSVTLISVPYCTYIHNENVLLLPESTFLESGRPIQFFQSPDMSDTGAGSIVLSPEFCVCER